MFTLKAGPVIFGREPKIIGVLDRKYSSEDLDAASLGGVDAVEIRFDLFGEDFGASLEYATKVRQRGDFGIIGTMREAPWNEGRRPEYFSKIADVSDLVDIEADSDDKKECASAVKDSEAGILLSVHYFDRAPLDTELDEVMADKSGIGPGITKIAALAENEADILRLMSYSSRNAEKGLIMVPMGEKASIFRFASCLFGTPALYGCFDKPVAPGQLSTDEIHRLLLKFYPGYKNTLTAGKAPRNTFRAS